ncbi:tRNA adenosine(34) deaminase TadA [Bacilliculturomica massiliensis]|uniref:tRNA adenosine(34) deaminase TadA n=1 Tax=Bacilliculturomica massiliensis TaxID=1917867 RepID=UPI001A91E793|nr:tRNA adenosine(34) deaminase TadA [Bacilliculturomica massiliensis]
MDINEGEKRASEHADFMKLALEEARKAYDMGEVPVGAVIVRDGEIVGRGHNLTHTVKDPTAHAEIIALRDAARTLGGWRLPGCTMYVTTEPCSMCAGAIVLSRMPRLFIGTMDPKAGACGSVYNIVADSRLNHRVETETGLLAEECGQLMKEFFRSLRKKKQ